MNEIVNSNPSDYSKQLGKIDEVNSNKLSSLHSRINLNSRTNIEKDNIYDYEDSEMQEIPLEFKGKLIDDSIFTKKDIFSKHRREYSQSLIISSFSSEYYQNLMDQSFADNIINANMSSEMNSIRTHAHDFKKFLSNEMDKPQKILTRNLQQKIIKEYNNGEENIESDLDKTKENIEFKEKMYNFI
jgi:hypothetical protein